MFHNKYKVALIYFIWNRPIKISVFQFNGVIVNIPWFNTTLKINLSVTSGYWDKKEFLERTWTALDVIFQLLKPMGEVTCWFSYMAMVH